MGDGVKVGVTEAVWEGVSVIVDPVGEGVAVEVTLGVITTPPFVAVTVGVSVSVPSSVGVSVGVAAVAVRHRFAASVAVPTRLLSKSVMRDCS